MEAPANTVEFRFGLSGMAPKGAPELLPDGAYRYALNVAAHQEGILGSRNGKKSVGSFGADQPTCYQIRKLRVATESDPLTPSTNPRYCGCVASGGQRNIYRTTTYSSPTLVASNVDADGHRHWEMAAYSAGETGGAWAYFACPNKMLKDNGASPYATLHTWGIPPAAGVATAEPVTGNLTVADASNARPIVIKTAEPHGLSDYDEVTITGCTGNTAANGTWAIRLGIQLEDGSIIDTETKFRIFDTDGQGVAGNGEYSGGGVVANAPLAGNLDGGAMSSDNRTQPYDWRYTYISSTTGQESNPSQPMLSNSAVTNGKPLALHRGQAQVRVWGTDTPNVDTIAIYRRGGLAFDAWRLVGQVGNPGAGSTATFLDNTADADVQYGRILETDNDPPVTSTLAAPLTYTLPSPVGPGWVNLTVPAAWIQSLKVGLGRGSLVHFFSGGAVDSAIVASVNTGTNQIGVYLQLQHSAGELAQVNAITGQPCNLVASVGDAMVVAGDPNNPHILYKSKTGRPECFPVGRDAAGAITSIGAGTPANGIVAITEFRGQVLAMNVSSLFEVAVINGSLTAPAQVADKGLVAQSAWCLTETEVWFLSRDGIYSWDGGALRKRSEYIDTIFRGEQVNGIPPLDMSQSALAGAQMAYSRGVVRLLYQDITGVTRTLACEPAYGDRWVIYNENDGLNPVTAMYTEPGSDRLVLSSSSASGARFAIADAVKVLSNTTYTSDGWSTDPRTEGSAIPYEVHLPWFDLGAPHLRKHFQEIWLDADPQIHAGTSSMNVDVLADYSETPVSTITVAPPGASLTGRRLISLLTDMESAGSGKLASFGREARALSFRVYGEAGPVTPALARLIVRYQETGLLTAGGASDWTDLGYGGDKKLYQMTVEFDTAGVDRTLVLDTLTGVDGKTYTPGARTFTLSNPVITGPGRAKKTFPITSAVIAKMVRVRPLATVSGAAAQGVGVAATDFFSIHSVDFGDFEKYPPDIVSHTPWEDGGYDYDKYANQVSLEVDTGGVEVTFHLQADGTAVNHELKVNTTEADRQRNLTLPTGLKGKRWRLYCDPSQAAIATYGGKFQLFHHRIAFQQADRGEVGHTFDWDDLGHPYDKLLLGVTFEYDTSEGGPVTLKMDTLSGIDGNHLTSNVAEFVLPMGRGKTQFPLPADTVPKMVRVYPATAVPAGFKTWKYLFEKIDYPPDKVRVTPWKDASSPVDKEPSWLWIDADTSNVPATVQLQNEGGTVLTVTHNGTANNRKRNYAIPADTTGKMWRLLADEGVGGRFQLWDWGFERWQPFALAGPVDPPEVVLATPWNDCGYPFSKLARNLVQVINTGGSNCTVELQTSEAGTVQTFTVNTSYTNRAVSLACNPNLSGTLWRLILTPSTGGRAQLWNWALDIVKEPPEMTSWSSYGQAFGYHGWKFSKQIWLDYVCAGQVRLTLTSDTGTLVQVLPAHPTRAVERYLLPAVWGAGLNKTKLLGVQLESVDSDHPFRLYAEASAIEWIPCGADRRAAYQQTALSEFMEVHI